MKKKPFIRVRDLAVRYHGNAVLDGVSFEVEEGDYVGIVGPNGGGKTTLLKALIGLIEPDAGTIEINGQRPAAARMRGSIGYVPQRVAQHEGPIPATVREIVDSGRLRAGLHKAVVDRALQEAGIAPLANRLISRLSGGERQRAYLARALAGDPKILLLDEPFTGVDLPSQNAFFGLLRTLNKRGLTILFVSHDIDVVAREARSVLCLNRGLLCFGSSKLLEEPHVAETVYGKRITHLHHTHD